jgi:diacylglycerol O-acyltransferase / wax synthase
MIHLSGVDASFLHLETPEMPMHVGSLHILDLPKDYAGDFYDDVVRHVGSRLHLASVFERKLAQMPFEMSNPVWVDDDDVDLEYHIRRVVLSKPGSFRQLEQYVGRLHSSLIDRSRPLWEMFVIEGLHTGQMALYAKVHHAAIDGQAGVALAKALYDLTPEPRAVRPPRAKSRSNQYQLGVAELATAAMQNTVQQYIKLITTLPNAARAVATVAMPALSQLARLPMTMMPNVLQPGMGLLNMDMLGKLPALLDGNAGLPTSIGFGPRTPLNVSITNQRSFAARSVSLSETKALAKRAGVSLNDVVMAACSGALRRYMKELNVTLDKSMTAAVPVSLREAGNEDSNNQVTMMLATLATDIKDPLQRLKAINASTTSSKEMTGAFKAAIPTDFPSFGAPWIMTGLATLFGRSKVTDQIPPIANVAISNVPGVPVPLYVAGARMATYFPVSIPAHGCALNITVQSYNGALDYGLTACRRAVPDVDVLADYILEAHDELARAIAVLPGPVPQAEKAAKAPVADAAPPVRAPLPLPSVELPPMPPPVRIVASAAPAMALSTGAADATRAAPIEALRKATKPTAKPKAKRTAAKPAAKPKATAKVKPKLAAAKSKKAAAPKKLVARSPGKKAGRRRVTG